MTEEEQPHHDQYYPEFDPEQYAPTLTMQQLLILIAMRNLEDLTSVAGLVMAVALIIALIGVWFL